MTLTAKGRQVFKKLWTKSEPLRVRLLAAFRPDEAAALVGLLRRVAEAMAPPASNGAQPGEWEQTDEDNEARTAARGVCAGLVVLLVGTPGLFLPAASRAADDDSAEPVAEGPFKPDWDSLKQYQCPEWFRDAKFGIWAHWPPQCRRSRATGTRARCTRRATAIQLPVRPLRSPVEGRLQRHRPPVARRALGPGEADGSVQAGRGQVFRRPRQPPRQLRQLGQQVPAVELRVCESNPSTRRKSLFLGRMATVR